MPVQDFISFTRDERLVKEYRAVQIIKPERMEGTIAVTSKRVILFAKKTGLSKSSLAMDLHINKIVGTDILSESRPRWFLLAAGIALIILNAFAGALVSSFGWFFLVCGFGLILYALFELGIVKSIQEGDIDGEKIVNQMILPESRTKILYIVLGIVLIIVGIFPNNSGWLFILGGLGLIVYAIINPEKTFALEIKAESIPPLIIGRDKYSLTEKGPQADELIREIGALILDVQSEREDIFSEQGKKPSQNEPQGVQKPWGTF